jgi:hypothetical protein
MKNFAASANPNVIELRPRMLGKDLDFVIQKTLNVMKKETLA